MDIVIKCGESIELIQDVLEEIERRMPNVLWGAGQSPASWNPRTECTPYFYGEHVALFIDESCSRLTYMKDSEEYVDCYILSRHRNDTIISAQDFVRAAEKEDM